VSKGEGLGRKEAVDSSRDEKSQNIKLLGKMMESGWQVRGWGMPAL
jgi:hypothetical protein